MHEQGRWLNHCNMVGLLCELVPLYVQKREREVGTINGILGAATGHILQRVAVEARNRRNVNDAVNRATKELRPYNKDLKAIAFGTMLLKTLSSYPKPAAGFPNPSPLWTPPPTFNGMLRELFIEWRYFDCCTFRTRDAREQAAFTAACLAGELEVAYEIVGGFVAEHIYEGA